MPSSPGQQDRHGGPGAVSAWVRARRGPRTPADPRRPGGWQLEVERGPDGTAVPVLTVFLTGRECPWHCVFCDLWKHTLERSVAPGDIPHQLELALAEASASPGPAARHLKLYNAGSFFDPRAIPPGDLPAVARRVAGFERVIVECHPALVGPRVAAFRDLLAAPGGGGRRGPALEVALGIETVNPDVLPRLNKGVDLGSVARAIGRLRAQSIEVRGFILVQPPYEASGEAVTWARRSAEWAFEHDVSVVSLIPVRPGNGALEVLREQGLFTPPDLGTFEAAFAAALGCASPGRRVLADLWDLGRLASCPDCFPARRDRLGRMNRSQAVEAPVRCPVCPGSAAAAGGR